MENWTRQGFPEEGLRWDYNTKGGRNNLERYRQALLQGVKAGAKKPTRMAKPPDGLQKPDESPANFYETLCEAFWIFTPYDPDASENQWMINAAFVGQAQLDIIKSYRNEKDLQEKNATELLEIANKVFINRDQVAHRDTEENERKSCISGGSPVETGTSSGTTPSVKRPKARKKELPRTRSMCLL